MYTYMPISKIKSPKNIKQGNKKKQPQLDLANKGNKKLYLPVKNKTNLSTNWKTKLKEGAKWGVKQ